MRISMAWLREWLALPESAAEVGHRLTMAGLELDALEPAAPAFTGVRVGRVLTVAPHPQADRLRVCNVDAGTGETLEIVCGAPNVAPGMLAPVACEGAVLPGDLRIKRTRLRGVESRGMLCSAVELGLADTSEGLLALPPDAEVGADFRAWLQLDDTILDIDLTPNRADCLGMAGIAREASVLFDRPLRVPSCAPVAPTLPDVIAVALQAPQACPTYAARVIAGINPEAHTPLWLRERLRRAGVRPLHPVVDVTNFVLLEWGQPMHAFAADAVGPELQVRFSRPGEPMQLLNGNDITLEPQDLVIANAGGVLALAGIMGGAHSAVAATTTRIVLESAHFTPAAVAGRARAHGLHTDASHRFERGVDPTLPVSALERATALILAIAGGEPGPVLVAGAVPPSHAEQAIGLRRERIKRVLGVEFPDPEVERILRGLGCQVSNVATGWEVTPPRARFDLSREEDCIEELARIHGYQNLPQTLPSVAPPVLAPAEAALRQRKADLVQLGFFEAISFSFIAPDWAEAFYPGSAPLALANPISSELAVMRPGLWPGLVRTAAHNLARQQGDLRLFELGLRFVLEGTGLEHLPESQLEPQPGLQLGQAMRVGQEVGSHKDLTLNQGQDLQGQGLQDKGLGLRQEMRLGGLLCGRTEPEHWQQPRAEVDFFSAKGVVEVLASGLGLPLRFVPAEHPALHPGQTAEVFLGENAVGWVGALHPALVQRFELPNMYLFELDAIALAHAAVPQFQPLSAFPSIRRDLALVVNEDVSAGDLLGALAELRLPLLQELRVFDVYRGEGLEENQKSIALGLILRAFDRTLGDEDVTGVITTVLDHLNARLGARARH